MSFTHIKKMAESEASFVSFIVWIKEKQTNLREKELPVGEFRVPEKYHVFLNDILSEQTGLPVFAFTGDSVSIGQTFTALYAHESCR